MDKDYFFKKFKMDFLLVNDKLSYYEIGLKVEPMRCITDKFSCGFHFSSNEELIPMFQPLMSESMISTILQTYTIDKQPALNNYMPTVYIGVEENEHEIYFNYDPPEPYACSIELKSLKTSFYYRMNLSREDIYNNIKENLPEWVQEKLKKILYYSINEDLNMYPEFYKTDTVESYIFNYYVYYKIRIWNMICNDLKELLYWINPTDKIDSFFQAYPTTYISYLRISRKKIDEKLSMTVYLRFS